MVVDDQKKKTLVVLLALIKTRNHITYIFGHFQVNTLHLLRIKQSVDCAFNQWKLWSHENYLTYYNKFYNYNQYIEKLFRSKLIYVSRTMIKVMFLIKKKRVMFMYYGSNIWVFTIWTWHDIVGMHAMIYDKTFFKTHT